MALVRADMERLWDNDINVSVKTSDGKAKASVTFVHREISREISRGLVFVKGDGGEPIVVVNPVEW